MDNICPLGCNRSIQCSTHLLLDTVMRFLAPLQKLFQQPEHRLTIESDVHWISIRSYQPANRMLLEISSNKNLPRDHHLTSKQLATLEQMDIKPRRQGYSLGRLYNFGDSQELETLSTVIETIFTDMFQVQLDTLQISLAPSPSIHLYNRELVGQMKKLARSKDHQLRLQMYTILIDANLIALIDDKGNLLPCDTIGNFSCFGAFTDEKHALQYDPRGRNLQPMSMLDILQKSISQNAGSLWLNPKGETRGELYKTELEGLWSRVKRLM